MPEQLTRRQLLKALGFGGVGLTLASTGILGAAGVTNAAETASEMKPQEIAKRYWWVKNVDKPTTEIDWSTMKRFNEWETTRGSLAKYRGAEFDKEMNKLQKGNLLKFEKESVPGYTTKDMALKAAVEYGRPDFKFMGPQKALTPQERGVPRYEGTPEENARIVTAALRHMGAATVGFVELNTETTRKLIYGQEPAPSKKPIVFENIEVGYEDKDKLVIPEKARYAIVYSVQMSTETMKYGPTMLGSLTTALSYTRLYTIYSQLHEFVRSLGYSSYGATALNGFGIAPAFGVLAGLGELSRLNRIITPEYGPMVRLAVLTTDLPLTPTKPVNFGVMNFCKDCKTCAELCPSKALSMDRDPSWEIKGQWNNPGHRAYFEDSVKCRNYWNQCGTNCGICFSVCPYAVDDEASLHRIVKGTIASTTMFNSVLVAADRVTFPAQPEKPLKNPEDWWKDVNLAEMGIDTRRGGRNI
ncbi:reductive dehalogenase [Desulfosporosinus shakirovi]|uniref:reductive dehalogenase n=1 Tax=Desulfosporosinus shakirovi TaxID=2885154 RepID=UPI001E2CCA9F|nr:reductive dehalogenase [Desulfosporosinus sp. SRJS8]MCB8814942.1 reductive dehalogenase [Desulfosporosinus sp. SRJS8]